MKAVIEGEFPWRDGAKRHTATRHRPLGGVVPTMLENGRVAGKMKASGSPMHILTRAEVLEMWAAGEETLKEFFAGL